MVVSKNECRYVVLTPKSIMVNAEWTRASINIPRKTPVALRLLCTCNTEVRNVLCLQKNLLNTLQSIQSFNFDFFWLLRSLELVTRYSWKIFLRHFARSHNSILRTIPQISTCINAFIRCGKVDTYADTWTSCVRTVTAFESEMMFYGVMKTDARM